MDKIKISKLDAIEQTHECENDNYEYFRRKFVSLKDANNTSVSVYEIPPKKSAFPYHYHLKNEETFYIISGNGILKTPDGEVSVGAGDMIFFPCGEPGAHKLTNSSETDNLVYIDFDSVHDINVAIYPDSDKIGVFGDGVNKVFRIQESVDYYDGE